MEVTSSVGQQNRRRTYGVGLSFAICTNRPENLHHAVSVVDALGTTDELLVVVDLAPGSTPGAVRDALHGPAVRILENPGNLGLSYSRNRALSECANGTLVFIDDDVSLTTDTVEAIRVARASGIGIVGVLLVPRFRSVGRRWWLTGGQYHYVGVHHRPDQSKPWGACMAIDARFANDKGITFRDDLGRRGRGLQSGDDTSFTRELRAAGATERVLTDVSATHHINPSRERLGYLLRRAWWQGRSERRRRGRWLALRKEWQRNVGRGPAQATVVRRYSLGCLFVAAVGVGYLRETIALARDRRSK